MLYVFSWRVQNLKTYLTFRGALLRFFFFFFCLYSAAVASSIIAILHVILHVILRRDLTRLIKREKQNKRIDSGEKFCRDIVSTEQITIFEKYKKRIARLKKLSIVLDIKIKLT